MTRSVDAARIASRSLLATAEVTALASAAHVLAGGRLPTPGFLLAFAGVVFAASALALGRFLRISSVVPLVLVAQVALHASLDASHLAHAGHPGHPGQSGHSGAGMLTLTGPMLWAHLVTAVVTAIVLLLQEQVLAAVVAALRLPGPASPLPGAPQAAGTPAPVRPRRRVLLTTSPRRGPPRELCATS